MASNNINTKAKTHKFIVAKGRFGIDGNAYELGQVVELDDTQLARVKKGDAIGDILEPYKEDKKTVAPANAGTGNADAPNAPPAPPVGPGKKGE